MKTVGKITTILGVTMLAFTLASCSPTDDANPRIDDTTVIPEDAEVTQEEANEDSDNGESTTTSTGEYPATWLEAGIPEIEGWEIEEATEDVYEAEAGVPASGTVQLFGKPMKGDVKKNWHETLVNDGWDSQEGGIYLRMDEKVSGTIFITDDDLSDEERTLIVFTQYVDMPVS